MAAPAPRLFGLLLPALLAATAPHAAEDVAIGDPPRLAMAADVAVTVRCAPTRPAPSAVGGSRSGRPARRHCRLSARRAGGGRRAAGTVADAEARTLLEWIALQTNAGRIPFSRLDAFLKAHPDHPAANRFRRRAEEALLSERKSAPVVRSFFQCRQPLSPAGRIALAVALKADGKADEALALVRRSWRKDTLSALVEKIVLAQFGDALTPEDHRLRTERLLFRQNGEAARRSAARVSPDHAKLAALRLASARARAPLPEALIDKLPASLRGELSFTFLQAQNARRADRLDDAAKAMAKAPRDPERLGDGDGWWEERRVLARKLLDAGKAQQAYEVAAGHGAEDAPERIEAEWYAGFVALRFLGEPRPALAHFEAAAAVAATPISVARATYWQGLAHAALGQDEAANAAFGRAAEQPIAYYGQLARARLGLPDLPLRLGDASRLEALPGTAGCACSTGWAKKTWPG